MHYIHSDIQKWYTLERVNHKDNMYFVIYKEVEPRGLTHENITLVKESLKCDIVLRANGYIYFCQQITNAEIIEETANENNK
jgi:exosome complex RNA-binding protein Rrp4